MLKFIYTQRKWHRFKVAGWEIQWDIYTEWRKKSEEFFAFTVGFAVSMYLKSIHTERKRKLKRIFSLMSVVFFFDLFRFCIRVCLV